MTSGKKFIEENRLRREGKLPPKVRKTAAGRPKHKIDWTYVDDLLMAGCSGVQIAAHIGMHYEKFYDRCAQDNDMLFGDYARQKRMKGDSMLKKKQFDVAMEKDRSMLIWLGKQRLGQLDRPAHASEVPHQLLEFIHLLKDASISQQEDQNSLLDDDPISYKPEPEESYDKPEESYDQDDFSPPTTKA